MATTAYERTISTMGSQLSDEQKNAVAAASVAVSEQNAETRRKASIKKQTGIVSGTEALSGMGLAGNAYGEYKSGAQERMVKTQDGVFDLTQGALDAAESGALISYGQRLLQEKQQKKRYAAPVQKVTGKAKASAGSAKTGSTAKTKYAAVNKVLTTRLGDLGVAGRMNAAIQTPEQRAATQLDMKRAVFETAGKAAAVKDFAPNLIKQQQAEQNATQAARAIEQVQARIVERSTPMDPAEAQVKIDAIDAQLKLLNSDRNKQAYALRYAGNPERYKGATEAVGNTLEQIKSLENERSNYVTRMNIGVYSGWMKNQKNADFKDKSKVNAEATDDYYRGINNLPSMATKTGLSPAIQQSMNGNIINQDKTGHTGGLTAGEYMTPEEKSVYNYIYNIKGKEEARKYVDEISATRNERYAADLKGMITEESERMPILASAASVIMNGMKPAGAVYAFAQGLSGEQIDVNSPYFFGSQASNGIRGAVTQQIADGVGRLDRYTPEQLKNMGYSDAEVAKAKNGELRAKGAEMVGNALGFAYQTGMSIADFLLYAPTGSTAALTIMGTGAGSDAVIDAKQRGATDGQALAVGALTGIAEVFFEKFSLEHYYKMAEGSRKAVLKNAFAQMGIEASEELFTEITNIFSDVAIMGENSNTALKINAYKAAGLSDEQAKKEAWMDNLAQVGLAALGGLISGGAIGFGTMLTRPNVVVTKNAKNGVIDLTDETTVEALKNNDGVKEQETYDTATKDAAERTNAIDLEQMHATTGNPLNATLIDVATLEMKESGSTDEEIRSAREILGKMTTGQEVSPEEREAIVENDIIRNTFDIQEEIPKYRMNAKGTLQQEGTVKPGEPAPELNQPATSRSAVPDQEKNNIIEFGRKLGRNVEFRALEPWEDGYYENGTLILNENQAPRKGEVSPKTAAERVLRHELTHSIEGASQYEDLTDLIFENYAKKGASEEAVINGIIKAYKTLSEGNVTLTAEDARKELVAKFAEEHLLTDEKMIKTIVRERAGIAGKILNWVQFQLAKLRAMTGANAEEEIMLLKAERLYIKAFAEEGVNPTRYEYSPEEDSAPVAVKAEETREAVTVLGSIEAVALSNEDSRNELTNYISDNAANNAGEMLDDIKNLMQSSEYQTVQETMSQEEKSKWIIRTLSENTSGKKRNRSNAQASEPIATPEEAAQQQTMPIEPETPMEAKQQPAAEPTSPKEVISTDEMFRKDNSNEYVSPKFKELVAAYSKKWPDLSASQAESLAVNNLEEAWYSDYLRRGVTNIELERAAALFESEVKKIPQGEENDSVLRSMKKIMHALVADQAQRATKYIKENGTNNYGSLRDVSIARENIQSDTKNNIENQRQSIIESEELREWFANEKKQRVAALEQNASGKREVVKQLEENPEADPAELQKVRDELSDVEWAIAEAKDPFLWMKRRSVSTNGMSLDELLEKYGAFDVKEKDYRETQTASKIRISREENAPGDVIYRVIIYDRNGNIDLSHQADYTGEGLNDVFGEEVANLIKEKATEYSLIKWSKNREGEWKKYNRDLKTKDGWYEIINVEYKKNELHWKGYIAPTAPPKKKQVLAYQSITNEEAEKALKQDQPSANGQEQEKRPISKKSEIYLKQVAEELSSKIRNAIGYQSDEEYKATRRLIERSMSQITSDGGITKQKQDELFTEVMMKAKNDSDRARIRIVFDDAIFQARLNLGLVSRYEAAKHVRGQRTAERAANAKEMDLVRQALKVRKPLKQQLEIIKEQNVFTDSDNNDIKYILNGGQIDLNGRTNAAAMQKRLEVEKKLHAAETLISDYNKARKKYLFDQATRAIEGSYNWKNKKWGLEYSTETMERNIQDVVQNDAKAEQIIETYFTPVHQNEAESTRFKEGMRRRIKALALTADESKAAQLKGEGATLEQIEIKIGSKAIKNIDLDKVDRAVKEFRSIYDELLSKANDVLVQNGYAPIEYRKDYFPHFNDPEADTAMKKIAEVLGLGVVTEELPTDIAGLTAAFRPGKPFFGHMMERTGETTTIDAIRGFESYINGASDMIYHTEDIQRLRALESAMRYEHSNEGIRKRMLKAMDTMQDPDATQAEYDAIFGEKQGHLGHLVQEIREYTNLLANKKSSHDRSAEADFGRKMYSTVNKLNSRVAANMIAGNVGVALTNFIPLTQAWATTRTDYMVVGMAKTLENIVKNDGFEQRSDFLTNRIGSQELGKTATEKVSDVLSIPFTAVDTFVAQSIVRAQFMQNVAKGMSPDGAMKAADRWAGSIMADRSKGALPTYFKRSNPLAKMTGMFQVEVNNQFRHLFKDIPRAVKDRGLAALAVALFKFCVGAWIYNEITEPLTGRRAALDPVNTFKELSDDIATKDMKVALENLWTNIMDQTPFVGSLLGGEGGRIPISSALPDVWSISKNVIDAMNGDADWKKVKEVAEKELMKPVWYLAPPFMGGQIKKTSDGIETVMQGGSYTLDKNGKEQLQFRTDKELKDYAQAAIFGKWALPEGQEYVKNGFKFMSAKETEGYRAAQKNGVGEQTYMQIRMRLDGIGPTKINGETVDTAKNKQRRELMNWPDLTPEQKAAIDHYLIAEDDEKSPDYSSEALLELNLVSKDAHDEAVFVQKYGITPEAYLKYADLKKEYTAINAANDVPEWAKKNEIVDILSGKTDGNQQTDTAVSERMHQAIWDDAAFTEKQRYVLEAALTGNGTWIRKAVNLQAEGVPEKFTYQFMTEARDLRDSKGDNDMDYSDNLTLKLSIASESGMTAEQRMKLTDTLVDKSTMIEDADKVRRESGVSQETYYEFYTQYWTLNAKDANGKTVSGLKKKRAKELLDSLGISDEQQKYLLFDTGDYTKW